MRLLVTGTDGYLGCLLADRLLAGGHDVLGVDTGYYRSGWLEMGLERFPQTLSLDVRALQAEHLDGVDAVVHLAELSNDPLGALLPEVTYRVNHEGTVRLARLAKSAGVERFVYTSSCSVYGIADDWVDEQSPTAPQTAYAECKVLVERDVGQLADDSFSPTFLRNSTAFGASPRMRLDLVLNNLAALAHTTGDITLTSDGTPWRPLVHAQDIAVAVEAALLAPREAVHGEVFNVGSNAQNYQVREIAETVADVFPGCTLSFGPSAGDQRSYRVRFDKIESRLPAFRCEWDARAGLEQLRAVFERVDLRPADVAHPAFTRLHQLERLLSTGQVDSELLWQAPPFQRTP